MMLVMLINSYNSIYSSEHHHHNQHDLHNDNGPQLAEIHLGHCLRQPIIDLYQLLPRVLKSLVELLQQLCLSVHFNAEVLILVLDHLHDA